MDSLSQNFQALGISSQNQVAVSPDELKQMQFEVQKHVQQLKGVKTQLEALRSSLNKFTGREKELCQKKNSRR